MQWRIELLGGLRLLPLGGNASGETALALTHFESHKTAALLACLALHPERVHPREELCAYLWPDAEFAVGRNRLKQALASLRRMLEPPGTLPGSVVMADRFALRLCPASFESDVASFEKAVRQGQWQEARELWRGELLPGFYEEPLLLERERLNALHARVTQALERYPHPPIRGVVGPAPSLPLPVQHRLPVPTTPFRGRDDELAQLSALLEENRWVTLTGPGGFGKTRLALEAARRHPGPEVQFVGLTEIQDETLVPELIARTLEMPPLTAAGNPWEMLAQRLAERPVLLLLDNVEHLVSPTLAEALRRFTDELPLVRLLITSRVPLGSSAETILGVGPLPVPATDGPPEFLAQNPALQLFLDRARRVRADMQVTPRNAVTLQAICRCLEGIPLAIELCAASAHSLAPVQILHRLQTVQNTLLISHRRDTLERHRSLEGVLTSTCALLTPAQRRLLGGLTVFRGGWTMEMAEIICPTADTLSDLTALAEAALLQTRETEENEEGAASRRFTMLETIRQFVAVRFQEPEAAAETEARHTAYCLEAAQAFPRNRSVDEPAALEHIDSLGDNLRAAAERALFRRDAETVLRIAVPLEGYWQIRGYGREVFGWLEAALGCDGIAAPLRTAGLALAGSLSLGYRGYNCAETLLHEALREAIGANDTGLEAQVRYHLGRLSYLQGSLDASYQYHEAALVHRRGASDAADVARSCHALGQIAQKRKDEEEAHAWYQEAASLARRTCRPSLIADVLYDLASLAKDRGELETAATMLKECAETAVRLRSLRLQAKIWNNLGDVQRLRGDGAEAEASYRQSAVLFARLREGPALHFPLWNLACLAYGSQNYETALMLFACAKRLWDEVGRPLDEESDALLQTARTRVQRLVGPVTEAFWWSQGQTMSLDEAAHRGNQ